MEQLIEESKLFSMLIAGVSTSSKFLLVVNRTISSVNN